MKDKRNCGNNMNYPVYQQPMMVPPMGYPMYPGNLGGYQGNMMGMTNTNNNIQGGITSNTFEQQINSIERQINLLDQRVTRLENLNNNSTNNYNNKYNDSNYYMV